MCECKHDDMPIILRLAAQIPLRPAEQDLLGTSDFIKHFLGLTALPETGDFRGWITLAAKAEAQLRVLKAKQLAAAYREADIAGTAAVKGNT